MASRGRSRWGCLPRLLALLVVGVLVLGSPILYAYALALGRTGTVATTPARDVALVFGAGVEPSGQPSPYLKARLDLAYDLFRAGKVRAILVSGDNSEKYYNEPDAMRRYLVNRGIPAVKVVADYAGLDTYATCVRATLVFGATNVVAVTQEYHLPRVLATCRSVGLDAVGAGDTTMRDSYRQLWDSYQLREFAADYKMVWDLLSRRQPILGPRETSLDAALA